jgi:uncharacterized membrane protein YgdD (TMEM256/DUF423 family)
MPECRQAKRQFHEGGVKILSVIWPHAKTTPKGIGQYRARQAIEEVVTMRLWLALAVLGGFMAVALGAFAAHGLEDSAGGQAVRWLETGARYQMYHALAALSTAGLTSVLPGRRRVLAIAAGCFFAGMLLFSGPLYAMALTESSGLAMIVPVGGASYLAGWLALLWACLRSAD